MSYSPELAAVAWSDSDWLGPAGGSFTTSAFSIWNGSSEVSANGTIWNGSSEVNVGSVTIY